MEQFWKAHGLGNDYLVWTSALSDQCNELTRQRVVQICDRHRGLGSDGVLEPMRSTRATIGVRIWNPDGSIAEKSGNGIRIFAWWWAVIEGKVDGTEPFSVDTGHDVVQCIVERASGLVTVDMGQATFEAREIPTTEPVWARDIVFANGQTVRAYTAGIGNPHCVVFVDSPMDFDKIPWRQWGAWLESHALFPNRINVQFACVLDAETIEIRIWERGAGETEASGTSSCAVACVARKRGLVNSMVEMKMPGGVLQVSMTDEWAVRLCGPVEGVATMQTDL